MKLWKLLLVRPGIKNSLRISLKILGYDFMILFGIFNSQETLKKAKDFILIPSTGPCQEIWNLPTIS